MELIALRDATASQCATILLDEICLRFGVPRRVICDSGPQFIADVMQKLAYCLGIDQALISVYNPQANMAVHKNVKTRLAIQFGN